MAGCVRSQSALAVNYIQSPDDFFRDSPMSNAEKKAEAVWFVTIAASRGYGFAQKILASCFKNGTGTEPNISRAIYWMTKAAKDGDSFDQTEAQLSLSSYLLEHALVRYRTVDVLGASAMPKAVYWAFRAQGADGDTVQHLQNIAKEKGCHTCGKTTAALKACIKCKAIYYCGRDCQRTSWKAGHKVDCCDVTK